MIFWNRELKNWKTFSNFRNNFKFLHFRNWFFKRYQKIWQIIMLIQKNSNLKTFTNELICFVKTFSKLLCLYSQFLSRMSKSKQFFFLENRQNHILNLKMWIFSISNLTNFSKFKMSFKWVVTFIIEIFIFSSKK